MNERPMAARGTRRAAGIVFTGVLALTACAQTSFTAETPPARDLTELSLNELLEVKVTSVSKELVAQSRTAAAIYVITQEDIRRSGATTFAEVLRLAPGVQVARTDSDHWAVGVRGFGDQFSKSVLVLIDGRSVYTPLFAGVSWAIQDTLLADVDRIEVIRGPGGTIWGANAVNGVINIITKRAEDTQGVLASVSGGTADRAIGEVRYGSGNGRNLHYRLYGKAFSRAAESHRDGDEFDDWHMAQGGARLEWKANDRDTVTLQGDLYAGEHGNRVSLAFLSPPEQRTVDEPIDVAGANALVKWMRSLDKGGDLQVQAYYDRTRLDGPQLEETRNTFDVDFVHHFSPAARHALAWGLGARSSPGTVVQTVPTLDFIPRSKTNTIVTAFVQDELALGDRFAVIAGAKLEHNDDSGFELQPSARLRANLGPNHAVWAAVTRAVRTPSRIERDFRLIAILSPRPLTVLQIDGNPDFSSERLIGYEAGYRGLVHPRLHVDVAGFYNRYDDLAAFGPPSFTLDATPVPRTTLHFAFANGITGRTQGAEVVADWKAARTWRLQASYSYLELALRNKPDNQDTGAVATFEGSSPKHQAALQSRLSLWKGIELDQTLRYVSRLPAKEVDSYATLDARVSVPLGRRLRLALVGRNLLQPRHAEFGHDPPPTVDIGRAGYVQAVWMP